MHNIEDQIKHNLSASNDLGGLDCDALWNGISSTLDQGQAKKRRKVLYWIFAGLFVVIGVAVFYGLKNYSGIKQEILSRNSLESPIEKNTENNNGNTLQQRSEGELNDEKALSEKESEGIGSRGYGIHLSENQLQIQKEKDENLSFESKKQFNENTIPEYDSLIKMVQGYSGLDSSEIQVPWSLSPRPAGPLSRNPFTLKLMSKNDQMSLEYVQPLSWRIYAGPLWVNSRMKSETALADSLKAHLSGEMGHFAGAAVRLKREAYWDLYAGLEFMDWRDRFDKVIYSDTVLLVNQEMVMGKSIRTIEHYNTATMISLPVLFGLHKDWGPVRMVLQFGGSYTLMLQQSGRMLSDFTTVVDYTQEQRRYENFFAFRIVPSMGYMWNEKILLSTFCTFSSQGHKKTSLIPFASRSVSIMPSLGITYHY
jgi:hypothetical protein